MRTKAETLAYQRGYYAGSKERFNAEAQRQREMLAVAVRAERAEAAAGIGHCESCQHWRRPQPDFSWGICAVGKAPGSPYGCWAQVMNTQTYEMLQVSTSPHFGCVLFVPKDDAAGVTASAAEAKNP